MVIADVAISDVVRVDEICAWDGSRSVSINEKDVRHDAPPLEACQDVFVRGIAIAVDRSAVMAVTAQVPVKLRAIIHKVDEYHDVEFVL